MGYTEYICSICNDSYAEDFVNAKGHSSAGWSVINEPTFELEGTECELCNDCGETINQKTILKLIYGDADRDGRVNALDLTVIRKMLMGTIGADRYQNQVVDVNENSKFDIKDLVRLKKLLVSD